MYVVYRFGELTDLPPWLSYEVIIIERKLPKEIITHKYGIVNNVQSSKYSRKIKCVK